MIAVRLWSPGRDRRCPDEQSGGDAAVLTDRLGRFCSTFRLFSGVLVVARHRKLRARQSGMQITDSDDGSVTATLRRGSERPLGQFDHFNLLPLHLSHLNPQAIVVELFLLHRNVPQ